MYNRQRPVNLQLPIPSLVEEFKVVKPAILVSENLQRKLAELNKQR